MFLIDTFASMTRNYTLTTFNNNVGILTEATNNFALNVNGVFQASSAIISNNITASALSIGSITASENINVNNNITCGNANINGNITSQSANVNGNITVVSANINGYINGYSISISGNITTNSANINGLLYTNRQLSSSIAIDKNATSASLADFAPLNPLDVIGNCRNSTGVWLSGSDQRIKNNIVDADLSIC